MTRLGVVMTASVTLGNAYAWQICPLYNTWKKIEFKSGVKLIINAY